jgi:hypothetical protein
MSDLKCSSDDGRDAVVVVAWPDGRFKPVLICRRCLRRLIAAYVTGDADGERHQVIVSPVDAEYRPPGAPSLWPPGAYSTLPPLEAGDE